MIRFDQAEFGFFGGQNWLMLRALPECERSAKAFLENKEAGVYQAELKRFRPRRSLDANAYCWALLDKLSGKLGIPKTEIYRRLIPDVGGNCTAVTVTEQAAPELRRGWERNGIGWVTEELPCPYEGFVSLLLYAGSSDYDSAQMSRLIDLVVQECKAQGVETMTPEQLARLKEGWQSAGADGRARVSRAVDEAAVLDSMGPAAKVPAAGTEEEATA